MKKYVLLVLSLSLILFSHNAFCADDAAAPKTDTATATVAPTVGADLSLPTPPGDLGTTPIDNLEFISGEISAVDAAAKTVTVKLYGETEDAANDKLLTISLDDATDITDGEKDRDLKSLTNGTEVDVEYDPATKKATYIFVY